MSADEPVVEDGDRSPPPGDASAPDPPVTATPVTGGPATATPVTGGPKTATPATGGPKRWRSVVAILLVVLAAILAPLTVTAYWVHERILDTDGYVETVAPLADNEVVTDAVAARVVDELFAATDVENRIADVLPGPVDALGRTFTNSLRGLATSQTENLLESDAFQGLWNQANRIAHEQVVAMFSGKDEAVSNRDDAIVLDLGVVANEVRLRLVDQGVGILKRVSVPEGEIEITLLQSDLIPQLQTAFRVLDELATVLPILLLVVLVAAIAVAPRRRRVVIGLGLGIAAASSLLLLAIDLGRRASTDQAGSADLDADATKAVYDTLVVALRDWSSLLIVGGLFVAVVALVSSPGWIGRVAERLRGSSSDVPAPAQWAHDQRTWLLIGAVGVALVTLAVWPAPTLLVVGVVVLLLAFALGLITALARMRPSLPEEAAPAPEAVDQLG